VGIVINRRFCIKNVKLYKSSWTINIFIDLKYLINSLSDIRSMLKTIDPYANNNTYQTTVNNLEKLVKKLI